MKGSQSNEKGFRVEKKAGNWPQPAVLGAGRLSSTSMTQNTLAMNNVRQIHRYQKSQKEASRAEKGNLRAVECTRKQSRLSFLLLFGLACEHLCPVHLLRPAWACSF